MKLDHYLISYSKINSKWTKYLTIRPETVKLKWVNGRKPLDLGFGNDFLGMISKAQAMTEKLAPMGQIG